MRNGNGSSPRERVILVGVARDSRNRHEVEASLDELAELSRSAGADVTLRRVQVRPHLDPALLVGKGFVAELKESIATTASTGVIFDDTLSPAQQRNLEQELGVKVIDRPILILDIFASRARTAESRLQVELAQLEYTLPRLTGAWVHFSKQYGGIGAKGPGETQLEIDRRQVRTRIARLKEKLRELDKQRSTQRKARQELFKVALVGYTNAGKSTLFNLLTRSETTTADMPFTTLDSTSRVMSIGYPCRIIFSDTVGFIKKLPHQLIESFKSTLEEVHLADLLLHVVDAGDRDLTNHIAQTEELLSEIGADRIPTLLVCNKLDTVSDFIPPRTSGKTLFCISALTGEGIGPLKAEIVAASDRYMQNRFRAA